MVRVVDSENGPEGRISDREDPAYRTPSISLPILVLSGLTDDG